MRRAESHAHGRKGFRKNESVPALYPPAARILHVNRDNFGPGLLREKDNSLAELISWTARTVRCDHDIFSARDHVRELANSTCSLAGTRSPNDFEIEPLDQVREKRAVATGADQRGALAIRQIAFDHKRQEQKAVVPERADVAFVRRGTNYVGPIVNFEVQRPRPELQESMTECDQPSRAPALDLQCAGFSALSSFQR